MSAPALAPLDSVLINREPQPLAQDVANLAYEVWQRRGCPEGSAEKDWAEAERQLRDPATRSLNSTR